jgi:hypothetical protein
MDDRRISMGDGRTVFEVLFDLLQQIDENQTQLASEMMLRHVAGTSLDGYPQDLAQIVSHVPAEAREWFETCLCVRVQQAGRQSAWTSFARHR